MSYPFIKHTAKADELAAHLKTHFGIEKTGTKDELFQTILEQEQIAGYMRNESSTNQPPTSIVSNTDLPLLQQKRVKVRIASSETDSGDVYIGIGDWDALIKRDVEVAIPESAYVLLANAGEMRQLQNKDGTLTEIFAPRYSITHLGYVA